MKMIKTMLTMVIATTMMAGAAAQTTPTSGQMTIRQCNAAYAALLSLDTYTRYDKDGKSITESYKLSGATRYRVAAAIALLKPVFEASERARLGIVTEIGHGKTIEPNGPDAITVAQRYDELLQQPCAAHVPPLSAAELNVGGEPGQNPVPPSVLSGLLPIMSGDAK